MLLLQSSSFAFAKELLKTDESEWTVDLAQCFITTIVNLIKRDDRLILFMKSCFPLINSIWLV